ncbi:CBN-CLC-1 protein [Caenorhabditis brenneri]|uniref:CBN-CLC-1 protein n=1 Tax=Caenorhabditis brenneri TaxID=135651 RepID=G0MI53_CAEBE|nr:CBN-CLC-1 protein [Caenorhabditis brenneri]
MCLSGLTQIVYGLLMAGSAILTAIALFTPSWNTIENNVKNLNHQDWNGLMPWSCIGNSGGSTCQDWWANLPGWMRCVVVCMIISLIVQIFACIYNLLTCLACCCKKYIIHPLTLFAVISTILLLIAVIVYAANWSSYNGAENSGSALGYSFWLAVGALILSAADVILGALAVFLGEHCC